MPSTGEANALHDGRYVPSLPTPTEGQVEWRGSWTDLFSRDGISAMSVVPMDGPQHTPTAVLRTYGGVRVVEVHGEIDLACVGALDEALEHATRGRRSGSQSYPSYVRGADIAPRARHDNSAVVDFRATRFMDVVGLRCLIRHQNALRAMDGGLLLVCPGGQVSRPLEIAGVSCSGVYDSLEEAISVARYKSSDTDV